jgi:asparagine synthase (glutamine-hydrolysing)
MATAKERFPTDTPDTKEAYFIREIFEGVYASGASWYMCSPSLGHFPTKAAAQTAVRWIPRKDWGCSSDPSGRSVAIHNAAYMEKPVQA